MEDNHFVISNPRQERALIALLESDSILVPDLGEAIGSLNPCQTILELRRQGFSEIILTERFKVRDRDKKVCHPGKYYIPEKDKKKVRDFLDVTRGLQNTRVIDTKLNGNDKGDA